MGDEGIFEQRIPVAELDSDPVHYPESDGRFLPENPLQAQAIISLRNDLGLHLLCRASHNRCYVRHKVM